MQDLGSGFPGSGLRLWGFRAQGLGLRGLCSGGHARETLGSNMIQGLGLGV